MTDFSLFEGDPLNRLLARIGLRSKGFLALTGRFLLLFLVTCVPTAFFAWRGGFGPLQCGALNFFGDIAALGQALLGYPLFIAAESIIGARTREAGKHFAESGLIQGEDLARLDRLHERVGTARRSRIPETICLVDCERLLGYHLA